MFLALYCGESKVIAGETRHKSQIHSNVVAYAIVNELKDSPNC